MNLTNVTIWAFGIVSALTAVHHIEDIQRAVLRAQARILYESRTETWGSPRFFTVPSMTFESSLNAVPKGNQSHK